MTELAQAEVVLVDARQALQAQRAFGGTTYELLSSKKRCDVLDVELNAAERRAILRQHMAELERENPRTRHDGESLNDDALIDEALYERRAQLNANGLDTSRIDALLDERKSQTR